MISEDMREHLQVEAIVLKAIPFKEYDKILTLFSPQGIFKLFAKVRKKEFLHDGALSSVLTRGEFYYTLGSKDLHRMVEGKIIAQHLRIRDRFETLQAADGMLQALLISQWPGKGAPRLYQLLCMLLEKLPDVPQPATLSTLFLIKLMVHEGMLQIAPSEKTHRFGAEQYHARNAPTGSLAFSLEEEKLLLEMAHSRSLSHLNDLQMPPVFGSKITTLFEQAFKGP